MARKKLEWIDWNQRKKKFTDQKGLELIVEIVRPPIVYETEASTGNPLNFQIEGFAEKAAKGTNANAFRGYGDLLPGCHDEYRSSATVTIELYRIIDR